MGNNYIIDKSFQLIRTNPLLTTNLQIVIDSEYNIYLESIDSHKDLNNDKYKHFHITKYVYLEDKIPEFYKGLPINIAYSVKYDNDTDIVYNSYDKQFDTIYWAGTTKIKQNEFYKEEYEYFAPLYVTKNELPSNFIILRVDDPSIYSLSENDYVISNTTKENFREEIINKWKCVTLFDMSLNTDFGYWLDQNYISNPRFPKSPLEFDCREYNFSRWYGIDYFSGVYTNKSMYLDDKIYFENPHFKFEEFLSDGFKNNELIFPNIANFKFLFDDTPASPFELKPYSINRYYGFYIDLELVKTLTPYRSSTLKSGLKVENNIFMLSTQESGSTMPFIKKWDDDKNYYIYAFNNLYSVVKILENGEYYYKIISDEEITITDVSRDYEIDIVFNDLGNKNYNVEIVPRTQLSLVIDRIFEEEGVNELYADLYLIEIDNKYHVIEKKYNEYDGLLQFFIRTDYAVQCNDSILSYWLVSSTNENYSKNTDVEDIINNETPITFPIYKVKFRDIKDFDFNRVNTSFADFDFNIQSEYTQTIEHKLYATEHRDASDVSVFKTFEKTDINADKTINVSSEYIATDELFEINKQGLTNIWRKNQSVLKWAYANSNSHSNYPYKLNNSRKVGSEFNRTTDVFNIVPNAATKTHDYLYRIGDFYESIENGIEISCNIKYYDNQTLSIQTSTLKNNYFDLDRYIESEFDYFEYFFKNTRYINDDLEYELCSNYSIFNNADNYIQSSTLFKGIKYNIYRVSNVIRDDSNLIKKFIYDNNNINFNGYKFSVILNDIYTGFTNLLDNDFLPLNKVYSSENLLQSGGTDYNSIHIFVNDKFKNVLIIVNQLLTQPIDQKILTLNNLTYFDQREGLTINTILSTGLTSFSHWGEKAFTNYESSDIVARNFINNINTLNSNISFYYIDEDGEFGFCNMNSSSDSYPLRNVSSWGKDFTPFIIECETLNEIKLKKDSFTYAAVKGPKFNIYDKYKTDFTEVVYDKSFIKEPLARYITINEEEIKPQPEYKSTLQYDKTIYRYSGPYEPIFKNIELFSPIKYNIISNGYFNQTKYGGFLNKIDNIGSYVIAQNELTIEINKIDQILIYIDNELLNIQNKIIEEYINNDSTVINKLLSEQTFYNGLKTTNQSLKTTYENLWNYYYILINANIPPSTTLPIWIFKDYALGLCDGNFASCDILLTGLELFKTSDNLEVNSFGFNIPLDATINGITITIKKRANNGVWDGTDPLLAYGTIADNNVTLIKPDSTVGSNYAILPVDEDIDNTLNFNSYWYTTSTSVTYGGDNDLWGLSITPQEINNNSFGVRISVSGYKKTLYDIVNTAYIDCIGISVHYILNGIETGFTYVSNIESNVIFDTGLYNFGEIDELMYSKVNETENMLKIKNTEEDKSIYPMVDEFGYSYDKRFIFKSSWDSDYYIRTKNEIL